MLIHRDFLPLITGMSVPAEHKMEDHTPLFVEFAIPDAEQTQRSFVTPRSWAQLSPKPSDIATCYVSPIANGTIDVTTLSEPDTCQQALMVWSKLVESAVDKALQIEHRIDPLRQPCTGLTQPFWGRCQPRLHTTTKAASIPSDRHGGYLRSFWDQSSSKNQASSKIAIAHAQHEIHNGT